MQISTKLPSFSVELQKSPSFYRLPSEGCEIGLEIFSRLKNDDKITLACTKLSKK